MRDGGIRKEEGHAAPSDTLLPTFFADVFFCVCTKSALGGSDFRVAALHAVGPLASSRTPSPSPERRPSLTRETQRRTKEEDEQW